MTSALNEAGDVVEFRRGEPELVAFLDASKARVNGVPEVEKAQGLVDMLDLVRSFGGRFPQIG